MNTSIASISDTGRTIKKVDIINDTYSRLRISGLTTTPVPEELELALTRLENMASEWESRNVIAGYNFEHDPDPNSDSGIQAGYVDAYALGLCLSLLPDFGKEPSASLVVKASSSLSNLSGRIAAQRVNGLSYPNRMARGSGNSLRYNRWARFYRNDQATPGVNNSKTIFIGDIDDYVEHFDTDLKDTEIISTYEIQVDAGLKLVSDSNTDLDVSYRLEGLSAVNDDGKSGSQVTIIVTTDLGRVLTKRLFFELIPRQ